MIEHNKKLSQFIKQAQTTIDHATEPKELLSVIEQAKVFNGNFKYNNKDILIYLACSIGIALFSYLMLSIFSGDFWILIIIGCVIAFFYIIRMIFQRRNSIHGLADAIFWRDVYFDNNLQNCSDEYYNIQALKSRFHDFRRGNYSQSINQLLQSHYKNNEQQFDFYYFNFHYVNERIVEKTNSDGKRVQEKVYDHYDRYGFIVPSNVAQDVHIIQNSKLIGHNKGDYEPASMNFRKLFYVKTSDVFQASKLLTPSIVELIESLPDHFQNLTIEFNEDEFLFSFTDQNTIAANRQYGFSTLEQFSEEIAKTDQLPRLTKFHTICNQFIRATQNNFD